MKIFYCFIFTLICSLPITVFAQCTMPHGQPDADMGVIVFNKDHKVMQYCNGDNWIGLWGGGGGSGLPTCADGEIAQRSGGAWVCNDGSSIDNLNATNLKSGTVPAARLGSGTADNTTYLRGDGQWAAPSSGGFTSCVSRYQSCYTTTITQACDVSCASGEVATGGGCHSNSTAQLYHYPNAANGWRCAHIQAGTVTVYARCCS